MRKIIIFSLIGVLASIRLIAAQTDVTKDSLSIIKLLKPNQTIDFGDIGVKFGKVIIDSRCPEDVTCVRAGEAIVEVLIYTNEKFIESKKLTISASGVVNEVNNLVYLTKDFKIYGSNLMPYPKTKIKTEEEEYQLEVVFQPISHNSD